MQRGLAQPLPACPPGAALRFAAAGAALAGAAGWGGHALSPGAGPLAAGGFGVLALLALVALARGWPHARVGPANLVTLARAALASLLLVAVARPEAVAAPGPAWALFAACLAALLLDGADGALARASGLAGPWGARFDMEVDSAFAALLALAALRTGEAGAWILLLGLMRYGFLLAGAALPRLRAPLPERWRRKAVCVVQIGTLVALLAPAVEPPLSGWLAGAATALLLWSFGLDARRLLRP